MSTLAAQHPELASLIQVSQAMRDQILHRWPETRVLPAARGNRIHGS